MVRVVWVILRRCAKLFGVVREYAGVWCKVVLVEFVSSSWSANDCVAMRQKAHAIHEFHRTYI